MDQMLEHNGEALSLSEWAAQTGISYSVLYARIRLGWDARDILTVPMQMPKTVAYKGQDVTVGKLSEITGLRRSTLYSRLRRGKAGKELTKQNMTTRKRSQTNTPEFRNWLFGYIVRYKQEHDGISPALTDIQEAAQETYAGVSVGSIKWGLSELRQEGRIEYERNQPRSIQIVGGEWRYKTNGT